MHQPGMTLSDFLLRLSDTLGVVDVAADGTESLPADTALVNRMKRAVRDGIEEMRLKYPNWYCLRQMVTLSPTLAGTGPNNVNSDPTRFALPWYTVGSFASGWLWKSATSGDTRRGTLVVTSSKTVAERNGLGDTGSPQYIAIVAGGQEGTWEAQIAPAPDGDYTLQAECELMGFVPTNLWERSPFGKIHDQTVLAAGRWKLLENDFADPRRGSFQELFDTALASSANFDLKAGAPASLGVITDPGCEQNVSIPRRQTVTYSTTLP